MRTSLILAVLLALSSVAVAEDIVAYETEGDAELSGSDPRVAALDEAFARGVSLALADVVAADVRTARKADLDREFVARARLWVAKFQVTKDTTEGERRQLRVTVRVDRDKVRAKLAELNIATMSAGEASRGRSVVVLLRVSDPESIHATYGQGAEKDVAGLGAISTALRGAGMTTKRATAAGPIARVDGDLPLSDDEADSLAADAKADFIAIAGVSAAAPVPVRGLPIHAMLTTAHVRVLERKSRKVLGQGTAQVAARGVEPAAVAHAVDQALVAAFADVFPPAKPALAQSTGFTGDDTPLSDAGVVLVRLAPKTPWGLVAAELKYLQGAKGVQRAVLRRLSPGGWVIGVSTSESIDRVSQIVKKAPTAETSARVKVSGDIVDVTLAGAP
ncbi:MAG: hypothetical protein SFX73_28390 [Kofleriaceae bacterium]|nr:hypothetical protein [Kofleriaceae bacterium]